MLAHELENSIAISRANDFDEIQIEYLLPADQGTICLPTTHPTRQHSYLKDLVITAWRFIEAQNGVTWIAKRGCARLVGGEHEVKSD